MMMEDTYEEVEIGEEGEDLGGGGVEGGASGGDGADGGDVELGEDGGEESRGKLIQTHTHFAAFFHFRHSQHFILDNMRMNYELCFCFSILS